MTEMTIVERLYAGERVRGAALCGLCGGSGENQLAEDPYSRAHHPVCDDCGGQGWVPLDGEEKGSIFL